MPDDKNNEMRKHLSVYHYAGCSLGMREQDAHILDVVRAYTTVGEICDAFREVFGTYTESSMIAPRRLQSRVRARNA